MNKFIIFAALVACALASSSSSSSQVPVASSSQVPVVSSSSSSSSVPVVSSSSSSVAPVVSSSSSSSSVPVEPSSSSVAPVVSSSSVAPENKTFVPYLPCEFNFTLVNNGIAEEYTGYINDKSLILLTYNEKFYVLARCDVPDDQGNCYVQTDYNPNCDSSYQSRENITEFYFRSILIPITYSPAEYPATADCPDGSKDCQKYCDIEMDLCDIVDKDNKIVGVESNGKIFQTVTYYTDAIDASVFAMEKCDNTTLDTPVNPCTAPSGSSAKSSSSAASFVQVAYAVVLAALLVALF